MSTVLRMYSPSASLGLMAVQHPILHSLHPLPNQNTTFIHRDLPNLSVKLRKITIYLREIVGEAMAVIEFFDISVF